MESGLERKAFENFSSDRAPAARWDDFSSVLPASATFCAKQYFLSLLVVCDVADHGEEHSSLAKVNNLC